MVTRLEIKQDVVVPQCRLEMSKGNVKVRGPGYYNKIDMTIREAKTLKSFSNRLKKEKPSKYVK